LNETSVVITEIAHLAPHKGQLHLIRAFAALQGSELVLLLAGAGPDRQELEQETAALGVSAQVHFLGERSDLAALLVASDVVALPSTFEGFGIVQAEAMYVGRPVIGGDSGGATEVVVDGVTGYLVPFGDVAALADRLQRLVNSPELRESFGRAGRERVLANFTQPAMTARYDALYRRSSARGFET
jgi:glycosyltransferase involved in cell wall biosynthesis